MRHAPRAAAALTTGLIALTACGGGGGEAQAGDSGPGRDTGMETGAPNIAEQRTAPAGEAPDLAEQVEAGDLPPLQERVPEEAVTLMGKDGVGQYGGEMQMAMLDADDDSTIRRYAAYEPLVRWDADWSDELAPGVAKEWEVSEDARTYTFHLEEGIRWSDGVPFTADDLVFGYEDVLMNEELTPGPTEYLMDPEGNWPEVTALDDHTVELQFQEPHGLFLMQLARAEEDGKFHRFPRHYLEQFHIDYNDDAASLAEEEGYEGWADMFTSKGWVTLGTGFDARWMNPDLPQINPWIIETPAYEGTRVTAVRNPYYWKVDEDGNQLPYVDRLVYDVFADQEVIAFRAAAGNISYQDRHFDHDFRPLLAESMEENGFGLIDVTSTDMNTMLFSFNHIHPDEEMREIFQDVNFKAGLSHAMDREEIIELVYFGQGEPSQAAPREGSPYYHQELAEQYLEHDVELAEEYLDQVLPEKDEQGRRLDSDGRPFTFSVDVATDRSVEHVDALQLVQEHWAEVGLTLEINSMDRDLRNERRDAGEFDVYVRDGSAGLQDAILRPHWYMPYGDSGAYAWSWGSYFLDGEDAGEAPPEDSLAWDQWEIYEEILVTGDPEEQAELMEELLDLSAEAFWTIGVSTSPNRVGVVADGLNNAPHELYEASAFQNPGPAYPAVWWWEDPESAEAEDEGTVQDEAEDVDVELEPDDS
ncbi:ABC transporter substrate-binding protein [Nesterenkonia lacusekhoensis]|uniref:Peptide/nickel transport system substrate-binding protein n=1 Tax=Nesterenkonia lacusekhoensis TaxID=150832 RepID=A0ABS4SZK9_9MICC|nr:ABC transporter substrate-binding protein [Nesterenkonia lacusekhoensis]MBP2317169.1 peptide/nickel transport system substrate-binding protein [Nesterenkonia lacusekhoensis]